MKRIFILLLIISFPFLAFSQKKIRNKSKSVDYTSLSLPLHPLAADFKTYSVRVIDRANLTNLGFSTSGITEEYLKFHKYEYVQQKGDLQVVVELNPTRFMAKELKTVSTKVKDGDKTKTIVKYYYEISYKANANFKLKDGKRDLILEEVVIQEGTNTFGKKKPYLSKRKLIVAYNEVYISEREKYAQSAIKSILYKVRNNIRNNYDEYNNKQKFYFYTIKKAAKHKLASFDDALASTKEAFTKTVGEEIKETMKTAVATWEAAAAKYDPEAKKQRQAFEAATCNLAQYYLVTREMENAKKWIKELARNPKTKSKVKRLNLVMDDINLRIEKNKNVEFKYVGTYMDGSDTHEYERTYATPASKPTYLITKNRDTIFGGIHIERSRLGIEKITVTSTTDGQKRHFESGEYLFLYYNNLSLYPVLVPGDKSFLPSVQLAQVVERNDVIVLFKVNATKVAGNGGSDEYSYFFRKLKDKTDAKLVSLNGLKFLNFNRGAKKYFSDCPAIVAKATEKDYRRTELNYLEMIRAYAKCKQ